MAKAGPSVAKGPPPHFASVIPSVIRIRTSTAVPKRMTKRFSFKNQQGQSMTEFALVLPILVVLLFGVIQFGIVFNNYITVTDAVRAGARKGAVGRHIQNPDAAVVQSVRDAATDLRQSDLNVTVASSWQAGETVTVTGSYPYSISLLGLVVKSGRLTSTTKERVE
jgi:Flp pilus assembly protein TadG